MTSVDGFFRGQTKRIIAGRFCFMFYLLTNGMFNVLSCKVPFWAVHRAAGFLLVLCLVSWFLERQGKKSPAGKLCSDASIAWVAPCLAQSSDETKWLSWYPCLMGRHPRLSFERFTHVTQLRTLSLSSVPILIVIISLLLLLEERRAVTNSVSTDLFNRNTQGSPYFLKQHYHRPVSKATTRFLFRRTRSS